MKVIELGRRRVFCLGNWFKGKYGSRDIDGFFYIYGRYYLLILIFLFVVFRFGFKIYFSLLF